MLLFAACTRDYAVVVALLACSANPSVFQLSKTFFGDGDADAWTAETPLHASVRKGRLSSVQLLLRHGASVEEHGYLENKRRRNRLQI
jgi:ankyrin repeat protein